MLFMHSERAVMGEILYPLFFVFKELLDRRSRSGMEEKWNRQEM